MTASTLTPIKPNEVSYLIEARIRGVDPNRLTAIRFGQKDDDYLHPPERPNRYHNPFGEDFTVADLPIGARYLKPSL